MTSSRIEKLRFDHRQVSLLPKLGSQFLNWPVVYLLDNGQRVYVGETVNAAARMKQHLASPTKAGLRHVRILIDETFNKSVCLDLESFLIRLLAGDGRYEVLNGNEGITNADYFDRSRYREQFERIFDDLQNEGLFSRSIPEIENSDLFKLSPFKALTDEQAVAVDQILESLFEDLETERDGMTIVQGEPGTGKTIVAIYLIKLLRDIQFADSTSEPDGDSRFAEFFVKDYIGLLKDFKVALVVPQQSLRKSIQRVFRKTPALSPAMVMSPFDLGKSDELYDLVVVDEAHRLSQRANQPSGPLNKLFREINERLFGTDDVTRTQLDWIRARSRHQLLLVDVNQTVRPADLPTALLRSLADEARADGRLFPLHSQLRVSAGDDYIGFVKALLSDDPPAPRAFPRYDFRFFDDLGEMHEAIRGRDAEVGLARLVAGFAWPWVSKNNKHAVDIELDGVGLRWNSTQTDWINAPGSINEVGSIHTVQGYDLNYAGVIVGPDLRIDPESGRLVAIRASYFDKKGKEDNPKLGIKYSDEDLLRYIQNVYAVLLTRGIRGTYVYIVDPVLRKRLGGLLEFTAEESS